MGSVRLYGATSGYLELQAPDVSPDAALVLPSTGFGKVLQVVRATDSTNRTTTSTSYVDVTGMSVTITPTKSTSAIIVLVSCMVIGPGATSQIVLLRITDSSNNAISGAEGSYVGLANGDNLSLNQTIIGYATPATTSAVTYKLRFSVNAGTGSVNNAIATGQIYAIEVAA